MTPLPACSSCYQQEAYYLRLLCFDRTIDICLLIGWIVFISETAVLYSTVLYRTRTDGGQSNNCDLANYSRG